jgi:ferredoxin
MGPETGGQSRGMKISVDADRCTGIGLCESVAPGFFEVGDDGALTLLRDRFGEADRAAIEQAVQSCPAAALSVAQGS